MSTKLHAGKQCAKKVVSRSPAGLSDFPIWLEYSVFPLSNWLVIFWEYRTIRYQMFGGGASFLSTLGIFYLFTCFTGSLIISTQFEKYEPV